MAATSAATSDGSAGGGQIGCNYQMGKWIAGLEADIQGTTLDESSTVLVPASPGANFLPSNHTATKTLDWFSTARGRLGWLLADPLLIYATGGLAFGEGKSTFDRLNLNGSNHYVGSDSDTPSVGLLVVVSSTHSPAIGRLRENICSSISAASPTWRIRSSPLA